jgi:hypothetical protein
MGFLNLTLAFFLKHTPINRPDALIEQGAGSQQAGTE